MIIITAWSIYTESNLVRTIILSLQVKNIHSGMRQDRDGGRHTIILYRYHGGVANMCTYYRLDHTMPHTCCICTFYIVNEYTETGFFSI